MKTKLTTLIIALLGLSLNAASGEALSVSGDVGARYASDYHRRGEVLSAEALQAQVGFNIGVGAVDFYGDLFRNQSSQTSGSNTDEATFGLGTSLWEDTLSAYLGVYNTDLGVGDDDLEAFASLQVNTLLAPKVSVYKDTEGSLYTFEGQLSHEVDLNVIDLQLAGILGNTDASATSNNTYYGAKLTASKTFKDNLNLYADIALSDNNVRENDTVWGIGLNVKF